MISPFSSVHLALFDRAAIAGVGHAGPANAADNIVSANNGGSPASSGNAFRAPSQKNSVAFNSIFSVNYVDANKLKINLMERVGEAFGLAMDDFEDITAFGRAVREAASLLDPETIEKIGRDLGLDELGVSLDQVIDAMENPGGDNDRDLLEAIREKVGDTPSSEEARKAVARFDDIDLYSPTG